MRIPSLEDHRLFPFIAWGIIALFVVITIYFTIELRNHTAALDTAASRLEERARMPIENITDFSR